MILLWCLLFVYLIFLCGWFWVGPWADSSHLQILGVFGNWEEGFGDMTMNERKTIDLEQGWEFMQKGITKLKNILEGLPEPQFSSEDYMMLYTYLFQPHLVSAFVNILLLVIHNFFLAFLWYCFFFFFKKICLQNHLQHVHAKASPWLLSTALWQVPGVFWRIHIFHGKNLILLQSKYICQMYFAYSVWAKFNLSLRFAITE